MAGGNANDISAPWPKGDNSLYLLQSNTVSMLVSQTDLVWDTILCPFAFKVVKAEFCGVVANTPSIRVLDDTAGTPKEPIPDFALTAAATSDAQAVTVDPDVVINAGAKLNFEYTTVAGETTTDASLRLWVKPVF